MRKTFRYTWILFLGACVYLGIIFYSRWSRNEAIIQSLEEMRIGKNRAIVEGYGGGKLTILGFYATPSKLRAGDSAQLCYGVANSKSVRIEPEVENVWPSHGHCVRVTPSITTVYRLTAEDAEGNTETASTTLSVY
jgi:hypothetical protein